VLAGVSTEWYTRLEKGHIGGVSDDVLEAVARALQLDDAERAHLFDLARAARPTRAPQRRRPKLRPQVQWMLDSMTGSAAFVRNGRMDIIASNDLARALFPFYATKSPNHARFVFLDPDAAEFFDNWEAAAQITAALLRSEAGRNPHDKGLRDLIGELSTLSTDFRRMWAAHDVRLHHSGTKTFRHPVVGRIELSYHSMPLTAPGSADLELTIYTAMPDSAADDAIRLLSSIAATQAVSR